LVEATTQNRRWTVIASGILCLMLALVVLFTNRGAFFSPIAVVVVAAIGLAAVLLQLRFFNREQSKPVQAPVWFNILGTAFALVALFADILHLSARLAEVMALLAVVTFAISSTIILQGFRRRRPPSP
jgi:hypothetical protein